MVRIRAYLQEKNEPRGKRLSLMLISPRANWSGFVPGKNTFLQALERTGQEDRANHGERERESEGERGREGERERER